MTAFVPQEKSLNQGMVLPIHPSEFGTTFRDKLLLGFLGGGGSPIFERQGNNYFVILVAVLDENKNKTRGAQIDGIQDLYGRLFESPIFPTW